MKKIARGEIWIVNLDPVAGHEQGGQRPSLVLSVDAFNSAGSQDVFVVPITSKHFPVRTRVHVVPPEGGLTMDSYILCDKMRSVSQTRLSKRLGYVTDETMAQVEAIIARILGLST